MRAEKQNLKYWTLSRQDQSLRRFSIRAIHRAEDSSSFRLAQLPEAVGVASEPANAIAAVAEFDNDFIVFDLGGYR